MLARPTEPTAIEANRAVSLRATAFDRAERHSRNVRRLKWLLPAIALTTAAAFGAYSYASRPTAISVSTEGQEIADGKLVMANPKLEGFTKDGRPYSMTADRAVQNFEQQGIIDLEGIDARMPVQADNWATVVANGGTYDRTANTLQLSGDITLTTEDGMIAKLESADLDIGAGSMKSSAPVDIRREGSSITADSMNMLDDGKLLVFEKRVRMNIDPIDIKAAEQASGGVNASN